ncbi:MAG: hypothetical protein ACRCX2_21330 [Paraclostridium sp.]
MVAAHKLADDFSDILDTTPNELVSWDLVNFSNNKKLTVAGMKEGEASKVILVQYTTSGGTTIDHLYDDKTGWSDSFMVEGDCNVTSVRPGINLAVVDMPNITAPSLDFIGLDSGLTQVINDFDKIKNNMVYLKSDFKSSVKDLSASITGIKGKRLFSYEGFFTRGLGGGKYSIAIEALKKPFYPQTPDESAADKRRYEGIVKSTTDNYKLRILVDFTQIYDNDGSGVSIVKNPHCWLSEPNATDENRLIKDITAKGFYSVSVILNQNEELDILAAESGIISRVFIYEEGDL